VVIQPDLTHGDNTREVERRLHRPFHGGIERAGLVRVDSCSRDDGSWKLPGEGTRHLEILAAGGWYEDHADICVGGAVECGCDLLGIEKTQVGV
jgi:hypothetical protein